MNKKPIVCGHRGASGHAPENTLASFRQAREMGATWLEFDVQLSSDGILVVAHDFSLERTTNLTEPVPTSSLSLAELKALDAGSWFSPLFAGEPIPTLAQVLEEFGGILGLNIEIKSRPGVDSSNGIEAKVSEIVRRYNLLAKDKVIVSSFDPFRMMNFRQQDPDMPVGALRLAEAERYPAGYDIFAMAQSYGAIAVHPQNTMVTAELVEQAHSLGLTVNTWTANEADELQRLIDLRVDMIITNYPDRLTNLLK